MNHASLFSGIGGFDLAADWMGWDNLFHCENDEFCKRILKYYWPEAESYDDIKESDFTVWRGRIDILTGGFPCQPYSSAGRRLGTEDDRHLWPEMLRAIREIKPRWVVGENVSGLLSWNEGVVFEEVQTDLEAEGYEVQAFVLPAAGVGAPHRRDRVWIIAHCESNRDRGGLSRMESTDDSQWKSKECRKNNDQHRDNGTIRDAPNTKISDQWSGLRTNGKKEQRRGRSGDASAQETTSDTQDYRCGRREGRQCGDKQRRRVQPEEREGGELGSEASGRGRERFDTDTGNKGLQGDEQHGASDPEQRQPGSLRSIAKLPQSEYWSEWPTEPPLRGRDDGIPEQLDGITFSKWRTESIKGYGNAIVPQVALQIFKAIQMVEDM